MKRIIKWNPFPNLTNATLYCEGLHDDWEGFRVLLRGENTCVYRLLFKSPYYYQCRDESYFLVKTEKEGEYEFPHPFYIIENSEFTERFHHESVGIYTNFQLTHYAIYSGNDCIDVLSDEEPIAEMLGED